MTIAFRGDRRSRRRGEKHTILRCDYARSLTQLKAGEAAERPRVEASAGAKRPRTMIERGAAHRAEPLIDSGGRRQACRNHDYSLFAHGA
jgi:hypothetical protein